MYRAERYTFVYPGAEDPDSPAAAMRTGSRSQRQRVGLDWADLEASDARLGLREDATRLCVPIIRNGDGLVELVRGLGLGTRDGLLALETDHGRHELEAEHVACGELFLDASHDLLGRRGVEPHLVGTREVLETLSELVRVAERGQHAITHLGLGIDDADEETLVSRRTDLVLDFRLGSHEPVTEPDNHEFLLTLKGYCQWQHTHTTQTHTSNANMIASEASVRAEGECPRRGL